MEKRWARKFPWLIVLLVLMVGATTGISIYWWQKSLLEKERSQYETELKRASQKIQELESKMARLEPEIEEVPTTTAPGAVAAEPEITKECGILKRVYTSGSKNYLDIDYVQFLTGEKADEAAREDGEIGPGEHVPNDYYIRNVNPKIRTFEIGEDVEIVVETYPITTEGFVLRKQELDFATFKQAFENNEVTTLFWITLRDGVVVKIEEQYVP